VSPRQARSWVRLRRTEFGVRLVLVLAWCAALALAVGVDSDLTLPEGSFPAVE
jgi:hypothetical protein